MTADSNTQSGQEPERQHQNPYQVLPTNPGTPADLKRRRFSAAAITGMVLVSIVWAIMALPVLSLSILDTAGFSVFDFFAYSGLFVLLGGITGFITALTKGNKKLAARLYIIPSLVWQGGVLAVLLLMVLAFAGYDVT